MTSKFTLKSEVNQALLLCNLYFVHLELECFNQADVCFVLDSSGSICGFQRGVSSCVNWAHLLSFISNIIDAFNIGEQETRIGLVIFSTDAKLEITLDQFYDPVELKDVVLSLKLIGGETNTGKALHVARTKCFNSKYGEREGVPNIAVIITDGLPTVLDYDLSSEATTLKQISTTLAVGVTDSVEKHLLMELSSSPQKENENYFATPNFLNLGDILKTLVIETCQAPLKTSVAPVTGNEMVLPIFSSYTLSNVRIFILQVLCILQLLFRFALF